jgi:trimeric autotransporter adhesin
MSDVPSNLIPTRITQLPVAPVADENSLMMIVYQGNNYQIRVGDLLSVAGVPTSTQVIAGTGMTGGGALTGNVTLSIANGGVGSTQLAASGVTSGVYGDATNIPVFTVDSTGRVTAATTIPATISGYVPTSTQVIAGNGLSGGGLLSGNVTLSASYSGTAPQAGFQTGSVGASNNLARSDHKHPAVDLSSDDQVDNILGLNNGGTARSLVPAAGAVVWSGADGLYIGPVGVAGQVLLSDGSNEPNWADQSTLDVGQADNLNGGAANKIPFQSATNTTAFIDAPTFSNTLLKWNGTGFEWGTIAGAGTVTSVGLAMPSQFAVTNSPVTASGVLTANWNAQVANTILSGPTTGANAVPTFRAMVNADLPASGVTADTYGSTTAIPVITVNAKGVITGMTTAAITGGLVYQGSWNASTNTPTLTSSVGTNGYYYVVSVAGSTNLNGITDWQVGDWAIYNGTAWQKIDQTNLVSSVNGQTGVVSIAYADLAGSIPTWNQNTTGTAAGLSTTLAIGSGGTGQTTAAAAITALTGTQTSAYYLRSNGTNATLSALSAADLTGTVAIASGGTGQTTASAAFNALSPITTTGDLILGNGTNSATRLGIGANGYLLTSNGTTASWAAAPAAGVTSFSAGTTGFTPSTGTTGAVTLAGTLATTNGGTGLTSFTANGIPYASSTSALATGSALTFDGTNLSTTGQVISTKTGSATDATGQVYLNGSTSNRVEWNTQGTGAPAFTTRSGGTKLLIYPAISGSQVDYAMGIDAATLWSSVPVASSSFFFKWYGGQTQVASMDGTGAFTATSFAGAGTGLTGTASSLSIGGNAATATSATSATTATNLAGGAASQIPYQTGSGATTFLANGTAGQVLTSAGASAPAWGGINGGTF